MLPKTSKGEGKEAKERCFVHYDSFPKHFRHNFPIRDATSSSGTNTPSLHILSFRLLTQQAICFCVMSKTLSVGVAPSTLGPLRQVFSNVIMREWSREKRKMKWMHRRRSVDACTIFASFH